MMFDKINDTIGHILNNNYHNIYTTQVNYKFWRQHAF